MILLLFHIILLSPILFKIIPKLAPSFKLHQYKYTLLLYLLMHPHSNLQSSFPFYIISHPILTKRKWSLSSQCCYFVPFYAPLSWSQPLHMKIHPIAAISVRTDAQKQGFKIGVWSTAKYAAHSANVFLLELMGTSMNALATGTSLTIRASPNAPDNKVQDM